MFSAEAVLVCALTMLGRSASSFPPIELVTRAPSNDSEVIVEAYVRRDTGRIYVVTTGPNFRNIQNASSECGDVMAVRKLASILIHEEYHLRKNADEKRAYQAQLIRLTALGARVGSPPYEETLRAMRYTLEKEARNRVAASVPVGPPPEGVGQARLAPER